MTSDVFVLFFGLKQFSVEFQISMSVLRDADEASGLLATYSMLKPKKMNLKIHLL